MDVFWLLSIIVPTTWLAVAVAVVWLDATLGGWRTLASQYPGLPKRRDNGLHLGARSVRLENGGTGYPGVRITIHMDGMQLDMPTPVMRWFYPSAFLPWKDLVRVVRTGSWFWERVHLTFANAPDDPITIYAGVWNRILEFAGPVWREPQAGCWGAASAAHKPAAG